MRQFSKSDQLRLKKPQSARLVAAVALTVAAMAGTQVLAAPANTEASKAQVAGNQDEAYAPLVKDAQLFNGPAGLSLEFGLDSELYVDLSHFSSGSNGIFAREEDDIYRFDTVPESAELGKLRLDSNGSSIYNLSVVSSRVAYDRNGELKDAQLPENVSSETSAYLVGALEAALKELVSVNADLVDHIGADAVALLVTSAKSVSLRVYNQGEPLKPLFEVDVPAGGKPKVEVLQKSLNKGVARKDQGSLRVVALLENYKGSISEVAAKYLRDVFDSVDFDDVSLVMRKVGYIGESGLVEAQDYNAVKAGRAMSGGYDINFDSMSLPPISKPYFLLKGGDDAEMVTAAVKRLVEHFGKSRIPVIGVSDKVYSKLDSLWRQGAGDYYDVSQGMVLDEKLALSLADLLDKGYVKRAKNLNAPKGTKVVEITPASADGWLRSYLGHSAVAFASGATIGGGIQAGLGIYQKYQNDGVLPHQYSRKELKELGRGVGESALRGGVSSLATFNLSLRLPYVVAGAAVGVGNSLYDNYRKGRLTSDNLGSVMLEAGAESTASAVGAWIGGSAASNVPVPGSATLGALSGSLAGHYLYHFVAENYDGLKDMVQPMELGMEYDPF
ncbi:hypothetical protein [Parendozoicomonas haliclonae]|uniref:Uncharacterized protein n=1 Tax=Parendozoicomonas haliclonae TaxID=1960125 RepID=A0A1X7AHP3_9GAMM|nr:hypothetical protein [Parendozoicomonas haliclonae]SMA42172.1 hypothetical protein EHSB41UT_01399 [Parendozoicomonas haliclonae]